MPKLSPYQVSTSMIKRHLEHLEIVYNSVAQVKINSGIVGSDDGTVIMEVSSPITVDITASGANGLDTGSEASSTWYYVYLIYNPSTDTVAGLFSTSASSPTMPSGYTKKRLVGCVKNDGSSNFYKFLQYNDTYRYNSRLQVLAAGTATSFTPINVSSYVPPNLAANIYLWGDVFWSAAGTYSGYLHLSGDGVGTYSSGFFRYASAGSDRIRQNWDSEIPCFSDSTPNIYYRITTSDGVSNINVQGFKLKL